MSMRRPQDDDPRPNPSKSFPDQFSIDDLILRQRQLQQQEDALFREQQLLQQQYDHQRNLLQNQPVMHDFGLTAAQPQGAAGMPSLREITRAEEILKAARDALATTGRNPTPSMQQTSQFASLQQDDFNSRLNQPDPLQWGGPFGPTPLRPGNPPNVAISSGLQSQDMSHLLQKQDQALSLATASQQQHQGGASPMSLSTMRRQSMTQQNMMLQSLLARKEEETLLMGQRSLGGPNNWLAGLAGLQGIEPQSLSLDESQKWPAGLAVFQRIEPQQLPPQFPKFAQGRKPRNRRAKTFPVKFMETITANYNEDIMAWLPDGRSFVVINPDLFVEKILASSFKDCKYASFVRKLNRWGFTRLTSGTGTDCFYHPLFQRERIDLCAQMLCMPRTDGIKKKKPPTDTTTETRDDPDNPVNASSLAFASASASDDRPSPDGK